MVVAKIVDIYDEHLLIIISLQSLSYKRHLDPTTVISTKGRDLPAIGSGYQTKMDVAWANEILVALQTLIFQLWALFWAACLTNYYSYLG
jgi:hypothetical protein